MPLSESSVHPTLFRGVIVLYVVCIFALVASYFAVSSVDLGPAMYLQASSTLHADLPNAARGIVLDSPTGRYYVEADTKFEIGGTVVGEAKTAPHGHLHALLRPPKNLVGPQRLGVDIDHPMLEEHFDALAEVTVEAAPEPFVWPERTSRITDEKESIETEWEGDLQVKVIPPGGQVARGLSTTTYLLLVDRETHAPVSGTITMTKLEGMIEKGAPQQLTTDELGLVKVPLTATTSARLTLTATAGEKTGTGTIRFSSVPSQFSISPTQLLVAPGQPFKASVDSLHRSGGILADLYDGHRWVSADAFGIGPKGAGVQLIVPDDVRGPLVRLQVYKDLFDAGTAWDSRWLFVAPSAAPSECREALHTVLELHETHSAEYAKWASHAKEIPQLDDRFKVGRCDHWLEAALLAVPHNFVPAPLLLNTQQADRAELNVWKEGIQQKLMFATALVLLIGFGFVLLLVLQGLRGRQEHTDVLRALELETAEIDDLANAPGIDLERIVLMVQTIIIVLTLLSFCLSLLMLLSWL